MKYLSLFMILLLNACNSSHNAIPNKNNGSEFTPDFSAGPHVIVYKTRKNYNNLVPVTLSEDKAKITSYPDPKDLRSGSDYSTPIQLDKGYLLDRRGVNANSAFLDITYQTYANLDSVPSLDSLYRRIKDKNPFIEIYDCGRRSAFQDLQAQLNEMIRNHTLKTTCKKLK